MLKNIIKLIVGRRNIFYCLSLGLCLLLASFLNGLGISVIAPLLEAENGGDSHNTIVQFFYNIFVFVGIDFSIINILFFSLILLVFASVTNILIVYLQKEIQLSFEIEQKSILYKLLSNLKLSKIYQFNFGNVIYVTQQETRLSATLIEYFIRLVSGIGNNIAYFIVLCLISIKMTVYVTGIISLFFFLYKGVYKNTKILGKEIGELNDGMQQNINSMLYGYKTIKAFLTYNHLVDDQLKLLHTYRKKNKLLAIIEASTGAIFQPLALLIVISGFYVYHYSTAELFLFLAAIIKLYSGTKDVQNVYYKICYHYASRERIEKLEGELKKNQYEYIQQNYSPYRFKSKIHFDNVYFGYDEQKPVLKNISIDIPKGSRIGLVGKSGSGKSTLVDLLMRFYLSNQGKILIDDQPIQAIRYDDYIRNFGYVSQEPFMLNASIKDNLTLYRNISESDIVKSLKIANAWDFVKYLNKGIHTIIGENGAILSGGEKQRISLARAILDHPDILILDEATSALDNESEKIVREAIENLNKEITVIIIAHRLSTVKNADQIYVFHEGQIIQRGTYNYLASVNGNFKELLTAV